MAGTCIARHTLRIERPCYIQNAKRRQWESAKDIIPLVFSYFVSIFVLVLVVGYYHVRKKERITIVSYSNMN